MENKTNYRTAEEVRKMRNGHLANAIRAYETRFPHHKTDADYPLLIAERDRRDREGWDDGGYAPPEPKRWIVTVDITLNAETPEAARRVIFEKLDFAKQDGTFEEVDPLCVDPA